VTDVAQILDKPTADALLELATGETAETVAALSRALDVAPDRTEQLLLMRAMSRLLVLDVTFADTQTILGTCAVLLGDVLAQLPAGPLQERVGNTLVFLAELQGATLAEVIHRSKRVRDAERMEEAAARFSIAGAGIATKH